MNCSSSKAASFLSSKRNQKRGGRVLEIRIDESRRHGSGVINNALSELENADSANESSHGTKSWNSGTNDNYIAPS